MKSMGEKEIRLRGKDIGVVIGRTMGKAGFYKATGSWVPHQDISYQELQNGIGNAPQVSIPYNLIDRVEVNGNIIWRNRDCYDLGELGKSIPQHYNGRGNVVLTIRDTESTGTQELLDNLLAASVGFKQIE